MNALEMLNRMCHGLLSGPDIKAICKARGFPAEAEASPGILETLFLSPQGLSGVFATLESNEIALLHLLKHSPAPVSVSLFSRAYGGEHSYGTFNQRFQDVFSEVKQRLVRSGVLLWAEARKGPRENGSKMERYRFALPADFHAHLPPLIRSPRQCDGDGNWRRNVVGDKLWADLGRSGKKAATDAVFQIEAGELRMNGRTLQAANVIGWQQSSWRRAIQDSKRKEKPGLGDTRSKQPDEAVRCILSELGDGEWAAPEHLAEAFQIFCGTKGGAEAVCEAGWEWGLLARRRADGKTWYRLAPESPHVAPQDYLTEHDGCAAMDLNAIPFDALEQIVAISDQRFTGTARLLATPNFVKLGRADDQLLAAEPVAWLIEQTKVFADAFVKLGERRGKTVLHENVTIARVSDLSLKVAIEKALGSNLVSLKNDFVAFPHGLLDEVRRVVKKSGHVVKEVAAE